MSLWSAIISFALVAGLLTVIPGLDTALVLRSAIRDGCGPAFATALGVGTGVLVWGAAAAVGVSALLNASVLAYDGLRIAGACYMLWLGVRLIRGSLIHRALPTDEPADEGARHSVATGDSVVTGYVAGRIAAAWRRGFLTNLLNPKIGAFYVAVLPQFIPPHDSALAVGLLLALVHDVEGMLWFTLLILATARVGGFLRRRAVQRTVDGVTGSVLVGFGLRLGLSR